MDLLQSPGAVPTDLYWYLAGGIISAVFLAIGLRRLRAVLRGSSKQAHNAAQNREPPVELGETYELGVTEFTDHHSGERVAVGKVEGFVLFIHDVSDTVSVGDVISVQVTSFNRNRTSADAIQVDQ